MSLCKDVGFSIFNLLSDRISTFNIMGHECCILEPVNYSVTVESMKSVAEVVEQSARETFSERSFQPQILQQVKSTELGDDKRPFRNVEDLVYSQ